MESARKHPVSFRGYNYEKARIEKGVSRNIYILGNCPWWWAVLATDGL
jgi:hypothetical protein